MSDTDQVLTIDVVSDVVCPWCYLGEKRLDEALSEESGPVVVRWRPYQLDPTIPAGGLDRTEYMEKKFGKSGRLQSAHENLTRLGAEVGVPFAFDKIKRSPNTLDAHRLIRWAAAAGVQAEVADRLFKAYFVEGRDIGDRGVLMDIAGECGLDAGQVEKLLADGADTDLVREEIEQAQAMGVSGVPFFIFGGRVGVPGAQEPSVLRQAIAQARQEMAEANGGRERLSSGRVVEPGDKLGRQFDARRFILARMGRRRRKLQHRPASRRPTKVQLRRATGIVVDGRKFEERRQPTG